MDTKTTNSQAVVPSSHNQTSHPLPQNQAEANNVQTSTIHVHTHTLSHVLVPSKDFPREALAASPTGSPSADDTQSCALCSRHLPPHSSGTSQSGAPGRSQPFPAVPGREWFSAVPCSPQPFPAIPSHSQPFPPVLDRFQPFPAVPSRSRQSGAPGRSQLAVTRHEKVKHRRLIGI
eukprot:365249-Chlamydomonas_euryale.AAC.4